jgi:tetratricopeptide (TPR) repeat protein
VLIDLLGMKALLFIWMLMAVDVPRAAAPQPQVPSARDCFIGGRELTDEQIIASCSLVVENREQSELERAYAFTRRATSYRTLRDYPRALADYDAAIAIHPEFSWAHAGRGAVFRERGEPALAIQEYDQAIRLNLRDIADSGPGSEEHAILNSALAWGYFDRGIAYGLLQDNRRAAADMRQAASRAPEDPDMWNGVCWNVAVSGGDLDEARRACDTSLRLRPNHGPTLDSRGMVGLKQGRLQDAWNDYDAAVRTGGEALPNFLYGRGIAAMRLGRIAEGRTDLERATALNPEVPQFFARYGIEP